MAVLFYLEAHGNPHVAHVAPPPYPDHPYQSPSDLAERLISNGLSGISVDGLAYRINLVGYYYHLKGYWYLFLTPDSKNPRKRELPFLPGTSWDAIWERYTFDQELRDLVFDGIVTIEIFLKSYIASELAKTSGPFGYTTSKGLPGLHDKEYEDAITRMREGYERSSLPHLRHFRRMYSDPFPPICMLVDCLTYGDFKRFLYKGADPAIKRRLAAQLGIMPTSPMLATRSCLGTGWRIYEWPANKTAHHDRFWNCVDSKMTPKNLGCIPKIRLGGATNGSFSEIRIQKGLQDFLP